MPFFLRASDIAITMLKMLKFLEMKNIKKKIIRKKVINSGKR